MFVILVYDVEQKRVNKVRKLCLQYLTHVQNSVFEGALTEGKLQKLQEELSSVLIPQKDSCIIYQLKSTRYCQKQCYGKSIFHQEDILSVSN